MVKIRPQTLGRSQNILPDDARRLFEAVAAAAMVGAAGAVAAILTALALVEDLKLATQALEKA